MIHVLDTNILVMANGQHDGDYQCELNAVTLIAHIRESRASIGLDVMGEILKEYSANVSTHKPPKVGAALLFELFNSGIRKDIDITKNDERGYDEFPDSSDLRNFHKNDRKFVAVALAAGQHQLSVATDSHFWEARGSLEEAGVNLAMICSHRFPGVGHGTK